MREADPLLLTAGALGGVTEQRDLRRGPRGRLPGGGCRGRDLREEEWDQFSLEAGRRAPASRSLDSEQGKVPSVHLAGSSVRPTDLARGQPPTAGSSPRSARGPLLLCFARSVASGKLPLPHARLLTLQSTVAPARRCANCPSIWAAWHPPSVLS